VKEFFMNATESDIAKCLDVIKSTGDYSVIDELAEACHSTARLKGWWDQPRGVPELIALCHSELSEALEAVRKPVMEQSEHIPEFTALEEELADVIIRVFDLGVVENCRLGEAIVAKMKFNLTRPKRHGGKKH